MTGRRMNVLAAVFSCFCGVMAAEARDEADLPRSLSDDQEPAQDPAKERPPTKQEKRRELEERPDETSFYPIPAIGAGKNEGWTFGILGALLLPDENGDIDKVVSVAIQYRSYVKINGFADFRWTPSSTAVLEAYSYWAAEVENQNQIYFDDRRLGGNFNARFDLDEKRVATERFYGTGASTKSSAESSYTSNNYLAQARFGPYLTDHLSIQGTLRYRHFRVGESVLPDVPQMLDLFPTEYGIEGGSLVGEGVRFFYDTRNSLFTPVEGEYVLVYFENAHYILHGVASPFQIYGAEAVKLWPHGEDAQFVFVGRVKVQFVVGEAPFWELSTAGGGNSLRSYGPNRFTDNDVWILNLEERIRVWTVRVEGVTGEIQVAPFIDLGEVFRHTQDFARYDVDRRVHWSVGSGFRAVVHPYIVGRMDIGYGDEGLGITVGLDYPF